MKTSLLTTSFTAILLFAALLACGGQAAVDDLGKLKEKTCSCGDDAACKEESRKMARDWVSKHKDARGGDQEKAQELVKEIVECDLGVGMELAKAGE